MTQLKRHPYTVRLEDSRPDLQSIAKQSLEQCKGQDEGARVALPKLVPRAYQDAPALQVPRLLFQTFETSLIPPRMYHAALSWIFHNPDFEYRFFDDSDRRNFIARNFDTNTLQAYDKLDRGAFKADLWRYCALYVHGGVYADIDTVCARPLRETIQPNDGFIVPSAAAARHAVYNGFICATPKHPFITTALARAVELILAGRSNFFEITGPVGLGTAMNLTRGRNEKEPIKTGRHTHDGMSFRVLRKQHGDDPRHRRVVSGIKTLFHTKYEGYEEDLQALQIAHWKDRQI